MAYSKATVQGAWERPGPITNGLYCTKRKPDLLLWRHGTTTI